MQVYTEGSGPHTLLVCTGDELEFLLGVLREASRLAYEEGQEFLPGTSHDQADALLHSALAETAHLQYFRAGADHAEGDLVVVGAILSVTVRISEHLKQVFIAALRYFFQNVDRPLTHTLLGAFPDELWKLHFALVGKYPASIR
ncbi:MAG: hypothetical protein ABI047_03375 [Jatrophihabitantaceae bacterium]